VLGGDCSIVLGSALAMNRLGEDVGGRIGLVFVDGHSDFRHPGNASYVGAAAGEDLALVTGRGQPDLAAIEGRRPYFRDIDVVVLGIRGHDEYKLDLQAAGIVTRPVPALRAEGAARTAQWARDQLVDCAGYWVHVDVDVLDPAVMPAVDAPEPGGIAFPELELLLAGLVDTPHCLGVEITVFDPDYDTDGSYAEEITGAIVSGLAPVRTSDAPVLTHAPEPPAPEPSSPESSSGRSSASQVPAQPGRAGSLRRTPLSFDAPGPARPGAARPAAERPSSARPDFLRPDSVQADSVRPEAGRLGSGRSGAGRPDALWPDLGRPGAGRTGFGLLGSGRTDPDRADPDRADPAQPAAAQSEPASGDPSADDGDDAETSVHAEASPDGSAGVERSFDEWSQDGGEDRSHEEGQLAGAADAPSEPSDDNEHPGGTSDDERPDPEQAAHQDVHSDAGPAVGPFGVRPVLESDRLPSSAPGKLRPRPVDAFSLPVQRPAFDSGEISSADHGG
jgi:arginase